MTSSESKSRRWTTRNIRKMHSRPYPMDFTKPVSKGVVLAKSAASHDHELGCSKQPALVQILPTHALKPFHPMPANLARVDPVHGIVHSQVGRLTKPFLERAGVERRESATPSWSSAASSKSRAHEEEDGPRCSKRRRLRDDSREDTWQREEDARLLNKAFRTAEDEITFKDTQIAALRQELANAKTGYERRESELRQDLLFRHILARDRATREHEREQISLRRLVDFLKSHHARHVEKLEEEHRTALDNERTRTQEDLEQAIKDKQQAQDRLATSLAHLQNMQSLVEHTTAISKVFESDLVDLQRLDIEEAKERDQANRGEPPPYEALQDIRGYRTPYAAHRHQDNGTMTLQNMRTTISNKFMRDLAAATRTSLALREHEDRSKISSAGPHLFHGSMCAFATACSQLRAILEQAIEGRLEYTSLQAVQGHSTPPSTLPSLLNTISQPAANKTTSKLPSIADLGLSEARDESATKEVEIACVSPGPPTEYRRRCEAASSARSATMSAASSTPDSLIATTQCVTDMIYDISTHIFAALDVREYSSEKLCSNRCAGITLGLRLIDDTLLRALKQRLEAEPVLDIKEVRAPGSGFRSMVCTRCISEHCGGYCVRLHIISFNTTKLKSIRRNFDKISGPGRVGMYFNQTYQWLKEALENERRVAANAALPPTRQPTPVMNDDDMAMAMQNSVLDETQAAVQQAIRDDAPAGEIARRLQAMQDRHYPRAQRRGGDTTSTPADVPSTTSAAVPATVSGVREHHPVISAETRRQAMDSPLHDPNMAMASQNDVGNGEADVRASVGATDVTENIAHPPRYPPHTREAINIAIEEQLRQTNERMVANQATTRSLSSLLREGRHMSQVAHQAGTEDDDAEPDDGDVSDYVLPARVQASTSGIRTRGQLRRSSRAVPETPEP